MFVQYHTPPVTLDRMKLVGVPSKGRPITKLIFHIEEVTCCVGINLIHIRFSLRKKH